MLLLILRFSILAFHFHLHLFSRILLLLFFLLARMLERVAE